MKLFNVFNIWLLSLFIGQTSGISYNQPKLCANASWNSTAITFATSATVGTGPYGIFVNSNNTVYVADQSNARIQVWLSGNMTPSRTVSGGLTKPFSLFATDNGDIYVDNAYSNMRVDKWGSNSNSSVPAMYVCSQCTGVFVDINNMLYCSVFTSHKIISQSLNTRLPVWNTAAGTGTAGATSLTLNSPRGIFVDNNLNLYVADGNNNRIQKFLSGQLNGTTIPTGTITLNIPTAVVLDADGYLFIADCNNHRLIGSGPYGFQCIAACFGQGSLSNQLKYPAMLSFDSYGNIFVTDSDNNRIQKFLLITNSCILSYNLPEFTAYTTWSANGITFANTTTLGTSPYGIFIDTNNTIYVSERSANRVQVWHDSSSVPIRNLTSGLSSPYSIFVTINGDIYADNGGSNTRVDKWTLNSSTSTSAMYVKNSCWGLFIDINNNLYCSMSALNQVVTKSLNNNSAMWIVAAGADCSAPSTNTLNGPRGIYVDTDLNLYVADCGNNRIQLFLSTQLIGKTVATGTITLNCPSGIVLDANNYLYIVDYNNHRIVGSGPNGFRCLVGCSGAYGAVSNQLYYPTALSFDSYGNMYVVDQNNYRIQKFLITSTYYDVTANQPNLCPSTTWYTNAITFANSSIVGTYVFGVFIGIDNTVYVANQQTNKVVVWLEGSINPDKILSGSLSTPYDLFATSLDAIYVDNGLNNHRVDKFSFNSNISTPVMSVPNGCTGIFVDISNNLYCAAYTSHQIVKKWLNDSVLTSTIVAGTGTAGSTATTLNWPIGVFVDAEFNLYVGDCYNNRIQMFPLGQLTGITVAGASAPGTITLYYPNGIILDSNGYLFIADTSNNRVVGSGPYGFRCLFGCTGSGSSSSQLNQPVILRFDSYGNLFVADRYNYRIQKFILASNSCSLSYNQPTFCSNALWSVNAVNFASSSTIGTLPYSIFINGINTVYVPNRVSNTILSWPQWSTTYTSNSYSNLNNSYSLFMSMTGDIYIDNGYSYGRVDKYTFNTSNRVTVMNVNGSCYSLFIDINNNLYCSLKNLHQVVKLLLNNGTTIPTIAAGNGSAGSLSNMLNSPQGIYVDSNLNLYIADSANNRIQFVQTGQLDGVTLVGNGSSANITLNYPTGIVLDANGYLFIVDSYNHRIVASSSTGFRCIVGCSGGGSTIYQLSFPQSMAFDSYGNMYVTDRNNSRQYRPPPPLLLRAAAAVPQLALLLLPPLRLQAVAVLQVPLPPALVPQVALPLAVLLLVVAVPPAALLLLPPVLQVVLLLPPLVPQAVVPPVRVPQLLLRPPLVLQRVAVVPQVVLLPVAVAPQAALLPRPALAVPLLPLPPQVLQQVAAVLQVVLLRAAVAPQVAPLQAAAVLQVLLLLPLPSLVLQQVAAAPQAVLPRAVALLLPLPPPAVPLRAAAVRQVALQPPAAVLPVVLPLLLAVLQAALLPRPPLAVAAPQVALQPPAAVLQVVLPRAAVVLQVALLSLAVPQLAPLQAAAVLQVARLLRLPLAVPLQAVAPLQVVVPQLVLPPPLVVPHVARHPSQLLKD
ncbi:unnamed protein product [Adineta steineri]|uniref:NHL repeat containing protein-like protein n=1 Tax=Adineta steineri TaxID=433720 RepID=A0A814S8R5_9BILA|nr:unnamed protein product [Adineta steineri]CAF1415153.1 unnamed protein product [Adineta steineri]